MTDDTPFETKTVQAVRGLEARTISKWEEEGWEAVSQTQGKLRTEILIRRPKPQKPKLFYIGALAAAVLLATVIGIGMLTQQDDTQKTDEAAATTISGEANSSGTAPSEPTSTETSEPAPATEVESAVLTPETDPEFAALLELGNYCHDSIDAFSKENRGQVIAFEGNIGAMNLHGDAKTRHDILIGAGAHSETTQPGPAFQFRDVNAVWDLHYQGQVPDTIGVGTNLHVKAEVGEYEPKTCLFLIDPVETTVR